MTTDTRQARWNEERKSAERILDKHGVEWPRCGVSVGIGWHQIIDDCLGKLVSAGWDKVCHQIKQKFCHLEIYTGPLTDEQKEILRKAQKKARLTCEGCGEPHGLDPIPMTGILLCGECREEQLAESREYWRKLEERKKV